MVLGGLNLIRRATFNVLVDLYSPEIQQTQRNAALQSKFRSQILYDADSIPLSEPVSLARHDPWLRGMGIRLFRDVVPVGTFTPGGWGSGCVCGGGRGGLCLPFWRIAWWTAWVQLQMGVEKRRNKADKMPVPHVAHRLNI